MKPSIFKSEHINKIKLRIGALATGLALMFGYSTNVKAEGDAHEITEAIISTSTGANTAGIRDNAYATTLTIPQGGSVKIQTSEDVYGVYIKWHMREIPTWTLSSAGTDQTCGENGFLHEFVTVDNPSKEIVITASSGEMIMCDVFVYSEGNPPEDVQVWNPQCEKADILLFSTHSDDEILFFGGALPYYAGELDLDVQLVYFTQFWDTEPVRMHEELDGIWHCGVDNYPDTLGFYDAYSESRDASLQYYGEETAREAIVGMIRKYKPQVLLTQDFGGEYGHGVHQMTSYLASQVLEDAADASKYSESANQYGAYDVPKMYVHLYDQGAIEFDWRQPLSKFGGKTGLEIAQEAYKLHVSQQWCWFFVSDGKDEAGNPDDYEYSCAKFGLYRSLVGDDKGETADFMENLIPYKDQVTYGKEITNITKALDDVYSEAETVRTTRVKKISLLKRTSAKIIILIITLIVVAVIYGMLTTQATVRMKKERARKAKLKREAQERADARVARRNEYFNKTPGARDHMNKNSSEQGRPATNKNRQSSQSRRDDKTTKIASDNARVGKAVSRPNGKQVTKSDKPIAKSNRPVSNNTNRPTSKTSSRPNDKPANRSGNKNTARPSNRPSTNRPGSSNRPSGKRPSGHNHNN